MTARWRFEWIEGPEILSASFLRAWSGLVARARNANVFQQPLLARVWLETKGAALRVMPRFCLASSDFGAEVLIPFCEVPQSRRNVWRRRLISVGEPHFDYQDPVAAWPEGDEPPWAGFWPSLRDELARRSRWDHAMLLRVAKSYSSPDAPPDTARESPLIRLEGRTALDDVLKNRSANHRTDVRRRIRRLQELGRLEFHVYAAEERAAAMQDLRGLRESHERLWAGTPSQGLFSQPGTFAFYERLVEVALPAGLVHFSVQRLADRPISWHFGFLDGRVLHWYKPTYEKKFEDLSPGKVHLARLVELGVGDGWREIDLGPGTESYKRLWTDDVRPLVQWHWQADSLRGKLYQAGRRAYDLLRKRRAP